MNNMVSAIGNATGTALSVEDSGSGNSHRYRLTLRGPFVCCHAAKHSEEEFEITINGEYEMEELLLFLKEYLSKHFNKTVGRD